MNRKFAFWLVFGMVGGIAFGLGCHAWLAPAQLGTATDVLGLVTTIFLRLIKMIIAPLVFSTLVAGIAHMGSASEVGRIGAKALGWFLFASVVSLSLGLLMVHLFQPGVGMNLPSDGTAQAAGGMSLTDFIAHLVPRSIAEAMANNEILQIVVFSVFVGTAIAAAKERAEAVVALLEQIARIMFRVTNYVMLFAPLGVFGAMAATVGDKG
ncbi:MAG TPA: cation:dicarboxylase symporter family transporter, partial [Rhizomicrobium sp.]|nr:cation:dicarboxylase symporter family transporter [Rhizomicrobium sp.]